MKDRTYNYPVILTEYNDESGHYFVLTSPNLPGLVDDGATIKEACHNAIDGIQLWCDDVDYPKPMDPAKWQLKDNQQIGWVKVKLLH